MIDANEAPQSSFSVYGTDLTLDTSADSKPLRATPAKPRVKRRAVSQPAFSLPKGVFPIAVPIFLVVFLIVLKDMIHEMNDPEMEDTF